MPGNKFDPMTGAPLPKFDPNTGQQNWWDDGETPVMPGGGVQMQPVMPMQPVQPVMAVPVMQQQPVPQRPRQQQGDDCCDCC